METDYAYDAVVVLGRNIRRTPGGFAPSTYQDSDEFGMLGGSIRIPAAAQLYLHSSTTTFVFSTGSSQKTKAAFGADVPTEAEVYSEAFKAEIERLRAIHPGMQELPPPHIILEDSSVNTVGNIRECFAIIREHPWQRVAIMSSRDHIPRIEALCALIGTSEPVDSGLVFIAAEDILLRLCPGVYDTEIATAYNSLEGKKRLASESQGLRDIQSGKYVMTEFQLHERGKTA